VIRGPCDEDKGGLRLSHGKEEKRLRKGIVVENFGRSF